MIRSREEAAAVIALERFLASMTAGVTGENVGTTEVFFADETVIPGRDKRPLIKAHSLSRSRGFQLRTRGFGCVLGGGAGIGRAGSGCGCSETDSLKDFLGVRVTRHDFERRFAVLNVA